MRYTAYLTLFFEDRLSNAVRTRAVISRLDKSDAGNADWQRDLSVSYNKIGDVLVAQGALGEALKSYRDSHAIFERRLMPLRPVRSTSCMRRV